MSHREDFWVVLARAEELRRRAERAERRPTARTLSLAVVVGVGVGVGLTLLLLAVTG